MKKDSYDKLNDGFVNLYEQGIFIRCYEKSAILLAEITGYKLYPNIDKKTGFIFLELGFPKDYKQKILTNLENRGNFIRIIDKIGNISETFGNTRLEIEESKLKEIKNNLIKFN
ncbi:MAG: hypothetical protein PHI37_01245 [Candidatus Gracilibacteria bacterium]|nr:hypothetical protein [Candidatus Gracilibacteria bacterium]